MTGLPTLTLWQPYASLAAAGVKTVETRTGPPAGEMRPPGVRQEPGFGLARGARIGLHAAAARPSRVMERLGVGDWAIMQRADGWAAGRHVPPDGTPELLDLPLGALVGTAVVVDAVEGATAAGLTPREFHLANIRTCSGGGQR